MDKMIKENDGTHVLDFPDSVTHLIVNVNNPTALTSPKTERAKTSEYGVCIVTWDWLKHSASAQLTLPEIDFFPRVAPLLSCHSKEVWKTICSGYRSLEATLFADCNIMFVGVSSEKLPEYHAQTTRCGGEV